MFDAVCKFLVETFSADFAGWLLGETMSLTELSPSELLLEPIRADVLLLQSEKQVLHLEFQTQPDAAIPFRMLDYWVRLHRRLPDHTIRQVVVYLLPSQSSLVQTTAFQWSETYHSFEVVRLWEQPTEAFLSSPGLLPLAILSNTQDPEATLRQAAKQIESVSDRRTQSNLSASTEILAGLLLNKPLIQTILRRDLMQESVIYRDIREQAIQEGLQQGLQQERLLVWRLLNRQIGPIPASLKAQLDALSHEQVESLGEALLDFEEQTDLMQWLSANV
ncbi:Rpn family recombination-promoting nuclease/putative transposase [Oscillatoria sp. CS-180]|uniref:Rpn family recombination-promoting nuclease/putative transposase n=1 Tax=Oscillatoria sp. CS-180 TaxID=3021720 RepID=UPI00232DE7A5|nr:Rpn family recombination-promoting nuclease/putative transposase [Oscillatoria sp. CS-180]MDB9528379.1 Rpn family recombination-promoting nuclease/putative transposase [Oscillatoria sp. CS-180]